MKKKILLSGVKPTGRPHIGNYFGAMKQFVDLQKKYQSQIFIADIHALNFIQEKKKMEEGIYDLVLDYLAIGLDPEETILYKQSDVGEEHTFLGWVINTLVSLPYAMRAHSYKDAKEKGTLDKFSLGDFVYPTLMASDILMYDPDLVPVGKDQKQHLEFTVDFAQKFNRTYGETFKLPKEHILKDVETTPGTDGRKMSKSYNNTIPLFASDQEIKKIVMAIPMDSKGVAEKKNPEDYPLYHIYKLFADEKEERKMREGFEGGGVGYGEMKKVVAEKISRFTSPLRERRKEFEKNPKKVLKILHAGGKKVKAKAQKKVQEIKEKVGFDIY